MGAYFKLKTLKGFRFIATYIFRTLKDMFLLKALLFKVLTCSEALKIKYKSVKIYYTLQSLFSRLLVFHKDLFLKGAMMYSFSLLGN